MIQIQAWQVDSHLGKLDLGLLVRTDKLKGILKLYTSNSQVSLVWGLLSLVIGERTSVKAQPGYLCISSGMLTMLVKKNFGCSTLLIMK